MMKVIIHTKSPSVCLISAKKPQETLKRGRSLLKWVSRYFNWIGRKQSSSQIAYNKGSTSTFIWKGKGPISERMNSSTSLTLSRRRSMSQSISS